MRLVVGRIYRAFRELDRFSDEECRRYVRRASKGWSKGWMALFPVGALLGAAAWAAGFAALFIRVFRPSWPIELNAEGTLFVLGIAVGSVLFAALGVLLARDLMLWIGLRRVIHAARCPKCRYTLMGLPIDYVGLPPPKPGDARVRCPECGKLVVLLDHGLTPLDLIPWEQREVRPDFAKKDTSGRAWAGRR